MMRKTAVLLLLFLAIAFALPGAAFAADGGNDHVYIRDQKEYPFRWAADLFEKRAQIYNNDLAVASAVLSWGIEVKAKQPMQELFTGLQIENLYMGCYDGDQSYKTWQEWGWGFQDGIFAIGHSILSMDSANDTTLLVIVGRGTMTPGEMLTDFFNNGNGSKFVAGKTVKQNISTYQRGMWLALENYLRVHPITTPKVKVLVTGHSLGGAMANLFGARIIHDFEQLSWLNEKATKNDVYVYTFGAIKVLDQEENVSPGYENIHNIYNKYDSFGPDGNLSYLNVSSPNAKFGHTDLFARDYGENGLSTICHNMDKYLDALMGNDMVHCASSESFEQDEFDGSFDDAVVLSKEDTLALLASISDTPLMAASGAGAWEGRLKINADATFSGYYYDEDADAIYESSFSGELNPYAEVYKDRYLLWVNEVTTRQNPGATAMSEYGIPIVYAEAPLYERDYVILTVPGTPSDEIPEMVKGEIGGVFGEWEDYSRFITLTRADDGWGFFADPSDPPDDSLDPVATATPIPAPTPDISRGEVLLDNEICTIVNLGKEMLEDPLLFFPAPYYRLAVTNHLNGTISIQGETADREKVGTVDGNRLRSVMLMPPDRIWHDAVNVGAGETVECMLLPGQEGYGFLSTDELVNTDVFINVTPVSWNDYPRDYELRMDAGPAYPRQEAGGYVTYAPKCLNFSFELPDNWKVFYGDGRESSQEEPDLNQYADHGSILFINLLPAPSPSDRQILISVLFADKLDELLRQYEGDGDCQRLPDLTIDGHRICGFEYSTGKYSEYRRTYFLAGPNGAPIKIEMRYDRQNGMDANSEHFLSSIRFATENDQPVETAPHMPDLSKGEVLVDDEICTIVNLGKEMRPADGDFYDRPRYRLAVVNHYHAPIYFQPGKVKTDSSVPGMTLGTVDGNGLSYLVFDENGQRFPEMNTIVVDVGAAKEIVLEPVAYGYGFRSTDELVNTDVFINVVYDPAAWQTRDYELRMDEGPAYPRQTAQGYVTYAPAGLGFTFELPDTWKIFDQSSGEISKDSLQTALPDREGFGMLPPPSANDCAFTVTTHPGGTQDQWADGSQQERLADIVIGGRRASVVENSHYSDLYSLRNYYLAGENGTLIEIDIGRDGSAASRETAERFLNSIRFTGGSDPEQEPGVPDEESDTYVSWPGIWRRAGQRDDASGLYIFQEEGGPGDYQVIQVMAMNGEFRALRGSLYILDEMTVDYDVPGILYGAIVGDPYGGSLSLTPFSAVDERMEPWIPVIEGDYERVGSLDDPSSQIPAFAWDLIRIGLDSTASPAVPDLSSWTGYWMTRDDSMAEMVITDNGDGTLHAKAMFLASFDFDATLTPQADGSMRIATTYEALTGQLTRLGDGALRLTFTGGYSYDDEEATEYSDYFAQDFTYAPAVYEDMWYQTAKDAAGPDDDWLGDWLLMNGKSFSPLRIRREKNGLSMTVGVGQRQFFGTLEKVSDTQMDFMSDAFFCTLVLNRKLNRIAMMEVGASDDSVYDWLSDNARYGVAIYAASPEVAFQIPENNLPFMGQTPSAMPVFNTPEPAPSVSLLPIPGKPGCLQVPVSRVDATSWIVGKDPDAYTPQRMIDGEETTAFQFSTKTTPLGQAYLYFDFDGPVTLDELWMKNGFWKTTDGKDQYARNSRVKKMAIEAQYAGESGYKALKTVSLKDDKARKDWKVIDMLGVKNVTAVRIRINEIFKGSKFPTDVCISEIMFVQRAEQ